MNHRNPCGICGDFDHLEVECYLAEHRFDDCCCRDAGLMGAHLEATPGPWDAGSRVVNSGGMDFTPIDAPEYAVAFVPVSKIANAHLIAAAPSLYEAAQVAMAAIRPLVDQGEDRIWRAAAKAMDALCVACSKARGEHD